MSDKKEKKDKKDKKEKKDKKDKKDKKEKTKDVGSKKEDKKERKRRSKEEKQKLKEEKKNQKKSKKDQKSKKKSDLATRAMTSNLSPSIIEKCKLAEKQNPQGFTSNYKTYSPQQIAPLNRTVKTIPGAEWSSAGKAEGLQIWRIEKFHVIAWPRDQYGYFYNGDSYIVLRTRKVGNSFRWDVHFWLGENTSQDEAGTAAYKTVELDDLLGGSPVQHREVQSFESDLFLSYFDPCIQILEGGIETGFRTVGPTQYRPRLLQVKGKKNARVEQVDLEVSSMNSGDVFILDNGLTIYQWQGKQSSAYERLKAGQLCNAIRDQRGGAKVITFSEGDNDPAGAPFWDLVNGDEDEVMDAVGGGDDFEHEKTTLQGQGKKLFRLSDVSGKLTMTLVGSGATVKKNLLDSKDAFILDAGAEIFAWVGKAASAQERTQALSYAQTYLSQNNKPAYLSISRIFEGGENEAFEAYF